MNIYGRYLSDGMTTTYRYTWRWLDGSAYVGNTSVIGTWIMFVVGNAQDPGPIALNKGEKQR